MLEWYFFKYLKIIYKQLIIDQKNLEFRYFRGDNVSIFSRV